MSWTELEEQQPQQTQKTLQTQPETSTKTKKKTKKTKPPTLKTEQKSHKHHRSTHWTKNNLRIVRGVGIVLIAEEEQKALSFGQDTPNRVALKNPDAWDWTKNELRIVKGVGIVLIAEAEEKAKSEGGRKSLSGGMECTCPPLALINLPDPVPLGFEASSL